jgi:hypothetical protein
MASDDSDDNKLEAIGKEMKSNPPAILNATRRKFGAARAEKQRKAILLSKGRQAGVKLPSYTPGKMSKGGQ